ncbi:YceD family protein [Miltoncostaea marina]|uniref:YceD family protein n=1 Tax=Miltoncostaea marina TaxID=2843215 RepID=UPI001C3CA584|nr:DUF177 domain-containing protein [Miltoncostaea marina]
MPREVAILDLRSLDIAPGAARRLELRVPPVALRLGGQEYATEPAAPEVGLEVARSLSGLHLRLRSEVTLTGPCFRCLGDARVPLRIDASEFVAEGRPDDAPFDEDLDSAYVEDGALDLETWARDAIAEAVPPTILCREDCAGLCATCGADLNAGPCGCGPPAPDPRWDALRGLAERLGRED